ncbi:ornithine cyclodeaminase family protein [Aquabacterium sp. J223]|uniref:ornithine cyclodeaminase family protein n=1 Tax=Aquabacterium sp. J223 TaxID=2898431 RepID=UPI0021AD93F1|nr:ornithine cyclodeaminase family protein [Aquabacterium sp. J223]UUX97162.1 ornithine cyclodeaminase family protein [Aquabacterium sp. J223]
MHLLDAAATEAALPFHRLIPALREAFAAGDTVVPPRQVLALPGLVGAPGVTSLVMPAWQGRHYAVKTVNIAPGNAASGLPGLHAVVTLFDAQTGVPLAVLDGGVVTARRTAAASALAGSWLAPRGRPLHLLVVGAGAVARLLPMAWREVRPLATVSVWARRTEQARALAMHWRSLGLIAEAADRLDDAVAEADVVSTATLAAEPLIEGRRLKPGAHLDLIGGFTPAMREADDDCFRGAGLWIDQPEALAKSGDLLGPMARGVFGAGDVRGTLSSLARGEAPGRRSDEERTVFKSVGTALEDLTAARLAIERPAG